MFSRSGKVAISLLLCFSLMPLANIGFAWADEGSDKASDGIIIFAPDEEEGSGDLGLEEEGGSGVTDEDPDTALPEGSEGLGDATEKGDESTETTPLALKEEDPSPKPAAAALCSVTYRTHVQNYGWLGWVKDGITSGTTGKSLRLEALDIKLSDTTLSGSIEYRTHVQNIGWQGWVKDGATSGTTGKSLRLEALSIRLTGDVADDYSIYYRVHIQNYGWLGWAKDGEDAGSAGLSLRMESIEIRLVAKVGGTAPTPVGNAYKKPAMTVNGQAHVQNIGWQAWAATGSIIGTTGQSLRVEALRFEIAYPDYPGSIEYRAHVAGNGWQDWKKDGALAGTTGQSKQLEAIEIKLSGVIETKYDIYYRAHIPNLGWLGWTSNGGVAGTTGLSCRIEALQLALVPKGGPKPGTMDNPYLTITCTSQANVASLGWLGQVTGRSTIGTTGQSRQMEAFKLTVGDIAPTGISGGIEYRAHVAQIGWQGWVANGAVAGTLGENRRIEAIEIRLTGDLVRYFDIYYRAYCADIGWMGWAKNGASAGTTNLSLRMEAFEIAIVIKGTEAPGSTAQPYMDTKRIRVLDPSKPMIALTFDDGPGIYTTQLLNLLDRYNARATFFVIGSNVNKYPGVVRDAYLRGNEIAGHSMSHQDYTLLSYGAIQNDITYTNQAIRNATGNQPPPFVRVPGGAFNQNVRNAAAGTGHSIIQWSIDPRDWEYRNANTVYYNVMSSAKPGAIVVLHDIHPTTITAMEWVIPDLIARGYQIVTVSELMYYSNRSFVPGQVYYSG